VKLGKSGLKHFAIFQENKKTRREQKNHFELQQCSRKMMKERTIKTSKSKNSHLETKKFVLVGREMLKEERK